MSHSCQASECTGDSNCVNAKKQTTYKTQESIHYNHDVVVYVPCYFSVDAGYPSFRYSMADATGDEQMAWSMNPDYVLILKGKFDAKSQPYSEEVTAYNRGERNDQS